MLLCLLLNSNPQVASWLTAPITAPGSWVLGPPDQLMRSDIAGHHPRAPVGVGLLPRSPGLHVAGIPDASMGNPMEFVEFCHWVKGSSIMKSSGGFDGIPWDVLIFGGFEYDDQN